MNDFSGVLNYKVVQDSPNPPPTRKFLFFLFMAKSVPRAHTNRSQLFLPSWQVKQSKANVLATFNLDIIKSPPTLN